MSETRNLTLALPKDLLRKLKVIAAKRDTSITAMVVTALQDIARDDDEYDGAMQRLLHRARKGYELGTDGRVTWTRDELHERRA